jgi:aminoglycoside phosphotransferase (APT) family kinase protein
MIDRGLAAFLDAAGISGGHGPLVPLHDGVYATRAAGRDLIVKMSRAGKARAAVWASGRLAAAGVPTPVILGYRDRILVQARCPGTPLDRYHAGHHRGLALFAAATAGRLLRLVHAVPVEAVTAASAAGQLPSLPSRAAVDLHALRAEALRMLRQHAALLADAPTGLVHGDWAARHVIVDAGRVTGIVGLASARGGDPLADLARWSLTEPPELTGALLAGYFSEEPDRVTRMRLALHRIRIGVSLLALHAARGERALVALRRAQLREDLAGPFERVGAGDYVDYRRSLDACC